MDRLTEINIDRHLETFGKELDELRKEKKNCKDMAKEKSITRKMNEVQRINDALFKIRTICRTEKEKQDI